MAKKAVKKSPKQFSLEKLKILTIFQRIALMLLEIWAKKCSHRLYIAQSGHTAAQKMVAYICHFYFSEKIYINRV